MKKNFKSIAIITAVTLIMTLIPATAFGATAKPKVTTVKSVEQLDNTSAEISWKYVNGAVGYKVYKANSKTGTFKLIKTVKSGKTNTYTAKGLKIEKTYYFKVKAAKKVNGKTKYSGFSKMKSVKMVQSIPKVTMEFPEKLNADGTLTVKMTNNSDKGITLTAIGVMFYDLNDWTKDGVAIKINNYVNNTTGVETKDPGNEPIEIGKGETFTITYELNKELQDSITAMKGLKPVTEIFYQNKAEGFATSIIYKDKFMYMAINYKDGINMMSFEEYMNKLLG